MRVVVVFPLLACAACSAEPRGGAVGADAAAADASPAGDATPPTYEGWLPVAPSVEEFGTQGSQDFLLATGGDGPPGQCRDANIALTMRDRATCYADSSGDLMCARREPAPGLIFVRNRSSGAPIPPA